MTRPHPLHFWSDINITIPPGSTGEVRTVCPQCAPNRKHPGKSLAVNVSKAVWHCYYCGWKGSLMRPGSYPHVPSMSPPGPRQHSPDDIQRRQLALERVWRQAHAVTATDPAGRYLRRRGLWQTPVPASLRSHPRLPYYHKDGRYTYHPALLARVQDPHGAVASIHRIYLDNAGSKADVSAPKKMMQTPTTVTGAAVRLDTPTDTLGITEGVETALAVRRSAGVPVWAALSADGMRHVIIPDSVRLVLICGDNDSGGTGQQAAKQLARRMLAEGRRVKIHIPSTPDTDWADGLEGASA